MRLVANVFASALMIGFFWGLKVLLYSQGERFTIGFGAGGSTVVAVLLLYRRFIGLIG